MPEVRIPSLSGGNYRRSKAHHELRGAPDVVGYVCKVTGKTYSCHCRDRLQLHGDSCLSFRGGAAPGADGLLLVSPLL